MNRKIIGDGAPRQSLDSNVLTALKEIVAKPYEKDEELFYKYKRIVDKASLLGHLIATRKPFARKNQETAALAMLTLLELNGYRVINYKYDMEELFGYLNANEERLDDIRRWIVAHLAKEEYTVAYLNE